MENKNQNYDLKNEFRKDWPLMIIVISLFIIGILAYQYLPEKVAVHWNIQGNPDGYMNRFAGTFLFPGITLGVYLLMLFTPKIDPKRENYSKFFGSYRLIKYGIVIFLAAIYIFSILYNLGYNIDIGKMVTFGVGALFVVMGNYMPKIRHNYFIGIRLPWTLADEKVWRKTHRLGGKLYVISGLLIIFSVFLSASIRFWILISIILISTIASAIYSYIIYSNRDE